MSETVAELLERAAIRVESSPGLNVLDAIRAESEGMEQHERDEVLADSFFRLLDYLPPHVDSLAEWSDRESSDRVAGKLRQLARTIRKGGPTHVEALSTPPTSEERELVDLAGSHNRSTRRPENDWNRESQLRVERGRLLSALVRMRRAKHPRAHDITERELRVAAIDRELAEIANGLDDAPPARREGLESGLMVGSPNA